MSKTVEDFSRAFYPFLHEDDKRPQELMEELHFSLMEKARESVEVKSRFFEENQDAILAVSLQMAKAFHRGRKLLVCGNGGSATDAQHIAVEFMHPVIVGRRSLPAICLTNDMAMVTAPTASIHRVQETHVTLYHIIWDLTHAFLQHKSLLEDADER